ncbi:MAG: 2-C-methyl-D-erythritol 4-phosphate cytidylyltransferase [Deltaproteobacteria bacterium]|nr:2-C-methyl-D-erythritol 4-phosphate cytidylyltransferase [Deltaproteobacteria bacterium]
MKKTDLLIIAAAGSSHRIGSNAVTAPKQFAVCAGKPLLYWALLPFTEISSIAHCIVLLPTGVKGAELLSLPFPVTFAEGGASRQESIWKGLQCALSMKLEPASVWIHDAARPALPASLVRRMEEAKSLSRGDDGIVPLLPVVSALKRVDEQSGMVSVEREGLMLAQTPQLFPFGLLRKAHQLAKEKGWHVHDDAELFERAGLPLRQVMGEQSNIKVTYAEDLELIGEILRSRDQGVQNPPPTFSAITVDPPATRRMEHHTE